MRKMSKRVLAFGAILGVFVSALLVILSILDVITIDELKETLGKTVLVIGVSTLATILMIAIGKLGKKDS
jgi:uncharacterized membrane protein